MQEVTKIKLFKILRGAMIAGGGVFTTYLLQAISQTDFGPYTSLVAGFASILINASKEFFKSYEQ